MARPVKIKNEKNELLVSQSNYLTSACYSYTAQEKRILYKVVEQAWKAVNEKGQALKDNPLLEIVQQDKNFIMNLSDFMSDEQKDKSSGATYNEIYEAFLSLKEKDISGYNSQNGYFVVSSIVNSAYRIKEGKVSFSVSGIIWQAALDFSAGWTPIDLKIAMGFRSAYSMRFYEMAKRFQKSGKWIVSVGDFRKMFGCEDKYQLTNELKRCIIEVAKKEMDEKSPISFTYECEKAGREIKNFVFNFYDKEEQNRILNSDLPANKYKISDNIRNYLKDKFGMTDTQINNNIKTFFRFEYVYKDGTILLLNNTYEFIRRNGKDPKKNIGMLIASLKKILGNLVQLK